MIKNNINTFFNNLFCNPYNKRNWFEYPLILSIKTLELICSIITEIPLRLFRLIKHLSYVGTPKPKEWKTWFWFPLLLFHVIDLVFLPEVINLVTCLIKFNTRRLYTLEIEESKKVYGDTFPYWKITIDQASLLANIGKRSIKASQLGFVLFKDINFTRKISCKSYNHDSEWLIHELTHVKQMEYVGSSYIFYALYAQKTAGYSLPNLANKTLKDLNFEQQAEIARFYYRNLDKSEANKYKPFINDLNEGSFI